MLIALSSKNAILIVEFAEQLRAKESSIEVAAIEAARIRLRPIVIDVLSHLFWCCAIGAGDRGRKSWAHLCGTTVFGAMIGRPCSTWFLFRCYMRWCAIWFPAAEKPPRGASPQLTRFLFSTSQIDFIQNLVSTNLELCCSPAIELIPSKIALDSNAVALTFRKTCGGQIGL